MVASEVDGGLGFLDGTVYTMVYRKFEEGTRLHSLKMDATYITGNKCNNNITNFFLFLIFFLGGHIHMFYFLGHWYPYFGFLVTLSPDFKARVVSALFTLCGWI